MKNKETLIKVTFFASFFLTTIGACLKTLHWDVSSALMAIGLLASIYFVVLSTIEVSSSDTISKNEKSMWIVGLIFISPIVGFIYILSGRKRILKKA